MPRAAEAMCLAWHFARARWVFTRLHGPALADYQNRRARNSVRFAIAHSPFYRSHWENADSADWRALPTVDKAVMMDHFSAFNTRGISRDEAMTTALRAEQSRNFSPTLGNGVTVGLSSGTSGYRGLFLASPTETAAWAGTILARILPAIPPRGYRIALFLRSNSNLYERIGASRRVFFRWFDLMTRTEEAVAALNEYAPHLLVGPPSLLLLLAEAIQSGWLQIRPDRLLSVAEVLEPQDKVRLEKVFGVPVGQIYQCTEGLLAVTCPHGQLHVQEDLVALQYEPIAGEASQRMTPIVTDLWRRTQPIIRYRLNDIVRLASDTTRCPCGSVFQRLDAVEGRCDDLCWFYAGDGTLRPFFPDAIRQMVLLANASIADYAAVQEKPGHLRFSVKATGDTPFDNIAAALRESAARGIARHQCRPAVIEVERGIPPLAPGAKRRRVRCLYTGKQ